MESLATISVFSTLLLLSSMHCQAQLSTTFYDNTCPTALTTIHSSIGAAVSNEPRMAASLIRLHFHDCFVQGCDASVLLDENASSDTERTSRGNNNSARGFEVIEAAKSEVEKACPGVVSCADILAVAARDASDAAGGPTWAVKLGRRDSITASRSQADSDLPFFSDSLAVILSKFSAKGLNAREMVALSGSHTIGQAQCATFRDRIYGNRTDIDAGFANTRRSNCPETGGNGNLAPLDLVTPNSFDNNYFKNLIELKGLLQSDQVLFSNSSTDSIVTDYSNNPETFSSDFASAMVKMGDIEPLIGENGIIRRICSSLN